MKQVFTHINKGYFRRFALPLFAVLLVFCARVNAQTTSVNKRTPNIIFILADDLGYGDLGCYGATKISTPNIDRLARQGLRFTNAHATSSTCTPSRYSIITGQYAWRKKGTGIAPGDARLLIDTAALTLPGMLQKAGYITAAIGKWHLGLGGAAGPDWNGIIKPGPNEIGFNYSYIMPATLDRVPTVFVENDRVVRLDKNDPITVSYTHATGNEPIAKEHPELLKMQSAFGHNNAIVNGVGRIGYMSGGKAALWVDENIADTLVNKTIGFIGSNKQKPFFIYFASHDIHVPRLPHYRFTGKSGLGPRGDAILELDWSVGQILHALDSLHLLENTMVVFSSDNGPVLNDGYKDEAVEKLNGHTPAGPLRGGKYSIFDAGTRVPFIVSWKNHIAAGNSNALISQVDLFASFATLTQQPLQKRDAPDSEDLLAALLGKPGKKRPYLIEQNNGLALIQCNWKYIEPNASPALLTDENMETGQSLQPQLYNLQTDMGEKKNVAGQFPDIVKKLAGLLEAAKGKAR